MKVQYIGNNNIRITIPADDLPNGMTYAIVMDKYRAIGLFRDLQAALAQTEEESLGGLIDRDAIQYGQGAYRTYMS